MGITVEDLEKWAVNMDLKVRDRDGISKQVWII